MTNEGCSCKQLPRWEIAATRERGGPPPQFCNSLRTRILDPKDSAEPKLAPVGAEEGRRDFVAVYLFGIRRATYPSPSL